MSSPSRACIARGRLLAARRSRHSRLASQRAAPAHMWGHRRAAIAPEASTFEGAPNRRTLVFGRDDAFRGRPRHRREVPACPPHRNRRDGLRLRGGEPPHSPARRHQDPARGVDRQRGRHPPLRARGAGGGRDRQRPHPRGARPRVAADRATAIWSWSTSTARRSPPASSGTAGSRRRQIAPIARQFLTALASAHAAGIIHRDLKPENIFILRAKAGRADFVKLIDFGISKFSRPFSEGEHRMTRADAVLGTPCYMSPEQARGARETDVRSDIYSCGVILYESVTGKLPFEGESFNDLMFKIALSDAPSPLSFVPSLDPDFAWLIDHAIARDPDGRFATAQDVRRGARRVDAQELADRHARAARSRATRSPCGPRRRPRRPRPRSRATATREGEIEVVFRKDGHRGVLGSLEGRDDRQPAAQEAPNALDRGGVRRRRPGRGPRHRVHGSRGPDVRRRRTPAPTRVRGSWPPPASAASIDALAAIARDTGPPRRPERPAAHSPSPRRRLVRFHRRARGRRESERAPPGGARRRQA